jgi:hypothetical protein
VDPELLQRLREQSGLRLTREDALLHRGEPIEHERLQRALRTGIHRAPDGRWATRLGNDWAYLDVEDAAYFVASVQPDSDALRAALTDGRSVSLDPAQLAVGAGDALYARLPDGERARFTRAAQLQIGPLIKQDEGGRFVIVLRRAFAIGVDTGPEPMRR